MEYSKLSTLVAALITVVTTSSVNASELVLLNTYDTGLWRPHAAAFDHLSDSPWIHSTFGVDFLEVSRGTGQFTGNAIPQAGTTSDDSDFTFIDESININGTTVPAGTLLFGTGDDFDGPGNDAHLYAIDPSTNAVLADMDLPEFMLGVTTRNNIVGMAHSSTSDTLFFTSYGSDGIMELDPSDGSVVNEFTLSPPGSPLLDIWYGDVEFNPIDGNLYVVGGSDPVMRVLTTSGDFVRDIDLGALGIVTSGNVNQLSGIGIDAARSEFWITHTNGELYQIRIPEPTSLLIGCALACVLAMRSSRHSRY